MARDLFDELARTQARAADRAVYECQGCGGYVVDGPPGLKLRGTCPGCKRRDVLTQEQHEQETLPFGATT